MAFARGASSHLTLKLNFLINETAGLRGTVKPDGFIDISDTTFMNCTYCNSLSINDTDILGIVPSPCDPWHRKGLTVDK